MTSYLTTADVAARLGITTDQVCALIASGTLRAVNVALPDKRKPRWRISEHDLELFIAARSARPPVKATRRRRKTELVTEYF